MLIQNKKTHFDEPEFSGDFKQKLQSISENLVYYRGSSMYPLLKEPEYLLIHPLKERSPRVGDVIAYHTKSTEPATVHRIVRINGIEITTRGDNNTRLDSPICASAILGTVHTAISRGRQRRIQGGFMGRVTGQLMFIRNSIARLWRRMR